MEFDVRGRRRKDVVIVESGSWGVETEEEEG